MHFRNPRIGGNQRGMFVDCDGEDVGINKGELPSVFAFQLAS